MNRARRIDRLSAALPESACPTRGVDPNGPTTFRMVRDDDPPDSDTPCTQCGRAPYRVTIRIAYGDEDDDVA